MNEPVKIDEAMIERAVVDHDQGPPVYELTQKAQAIRTLLELENEIVEVKGRYVVERVLRAAWEVTE